MHHSETIDKELDSEKETTVYVHDPTAGDSHGAKFTITPDTNTESIYDIYTDHDEINPIKSKKYINKQSKHLETEYINQKIKNLKKLLNMNQQI